MTTGSGTGGNGRLGRGEGQRLRRAIEFLRRHPGAFVVVAALGLVVVGVLNRTSEDGGEDNRGGIPVQQPPSRSAEDSDEGVEEVSASDDDGRAENAAPDPHVPGSSGATTTTLFPPDVARPRPPVDLEAPPDGSDPVEVARWWTATYVAYIGAEPGNELAQRLERLTTARLRQDLASMPPGASYSDPIPIEGVTANEAALGDEGSSNVDGQSPQRMQVVVETPDTLVVYDIVMEHSAAGWQVDEVTLL